MNNNRKIAEDLEQRVDRCWEEEVNYIYIIFKKALENEKKVGCLWRGGKTWSNSEFLFSFSCTLTCCNVMGLGF